MTRQALAELSALLAQRAVLAPPSQVAKDALKLARYADAAGRNADFLSAHPSGMGRATYAAKMSRVGAASMEILVRYNLAVCTASYQPHFNLNALPNTPPIQGYPEGYAI